MKPALGVSDFREIVTENPITKQKPIYFDKTLMIKDIVEDDSKFFLFTRPRRFGKTLNMDMLKCFFSEKNNLFDGLKISEYPHIVEKFQGKIPTILLSLKDVAGPDCKVMGKLFVEVMKEFMRGLSHYSFLGEYKDLMKKKTWEFPEITGTLKKLCESLYNYHSSPVLVLVDEYDSPLNKAYAENYLEDALKLFRQFFSQTFKDNPYLYSQGAKTPKK